MCKHHAVTTRGLLEGMENWKYEMRNKNNNYTTDIMKIIKS